MIAHLTGLIATREDSLCVIDVNGVGYLVHASTPTLAGLPMPPARATLLTELQVREDAFTLFGFADVAERAWFRLLTGVQGVGGRLALNILSVLPPPALGAAISGADKGRLGQANGVGPKLAARLVTELRDKAALLAPGPGPGGAVSGVAGDEAAELVSALLNLGYRRAEAEAALLRTAPTLEPDAAFATRLRAALKALAPA